MASSDSAGDLRTKYRESETASLWQSLGYGPQYKSAYCMAVCPAGTDVIGPYLRDRKGYVETTLRPLKDRPEPVYVVSGTRAEGVAARNPTKEIRYVDYEVGLASVDNVLLGLRHMYDATRDPGLEGTAVRCVVDVDVDVDDTDASASHSVVLAVRRGSLHRLDGDEADVEIAATAHGPLKVWMDLLTHAAAGSTNLPDGLDISGDVETFESLVRALH